eukprot:1487858-Prymnesium_polylepis.1
MPLGYCMNTRGPRVARIAVMHLVLPLSRVPSVSRNVFTVVSCRRLAELRASQCRAHAAVLY